MDARYEYTIEGKEALRDLGTYKKFWLLIEALKLFNKISLYIYPGEKEGAISKNISEITCLIYPQ